MRSCIREILFRTSIIVLFKKCQYNHPLIDQKEGKMIHLNYENLLASTGKFGFYQVCMLVWYQISIWVMCGNITFMLFGGIFPKCDPAANKTETNRQLIELTHKNRSYGAIDNCDEYFYSLVMEYRLIGSLKYAAALITSLQMLGVLVGPLIGGQISDRFGRKPTVLGFSLMMFLSAFVSAFVPTWQLHAFFRVLIGFGIGGLLSCIFTLVTECLLPKYRLYVYFGGWPLGFIVLALLAMATRHWKYLTLALCLIQLVPIFCTFFLAESPKWLIERDRTTEAMAALEKMCKFNRKTTAELQSVASEKQLNSSKIIPPSKKTYYYWHLFRNKESIKRSLLISLSWFTVSFVYYGIVFYSGSLPGDPALNTLIFGVIRLSLSCTLPILDSKIPKLGRKLLHLVGLSIVSLFTLGLAIILFLNLHKQHPMALIAAATGAICFGALIWAACELFSVELFPTVLRNMGNAMCNSVARIGSMIAPQVLLLEFVWRPLPMLIFFAMMLINGILVLIWMPETKGKPLPDLNDLNDDEQF